MNITFRGASVRYVDVRQEKEAGVFTRIHVAADYSSTIREKMDWPELPSEVTLAKLRGELAAQTMVLTPTDKSLTSYEMQLSVHDVGSFQFVRRGDGDERPYETALNFIVRTQQEGAAGMLENYIRRLGDGPGELKISYAKQEKLDLVAEVAGKLVPLIPEHSNEGEKQEEGAALASAVQMAGNTAELKRQKRARPKADGKTRSSVTMDAAEEPLRRFELDRNGAKASVTLIDVDGDVAAEYSMRINDQYETSMRGITDRHATATNAIIAAFTTLESWGREASKTDEYRAAGSAIVAWAREQAGEARQTARATQ